MKIFIKNMVCIRCKMAVKSELKKLGIDYHFIKLGEADIADNISDEQLERLNTGLKRAGLELIDDKKSIMADKIISIIGELVENSDLPIKINLSDYISDKLNHNYASLSSVFSEVKGTTIEQYYLACKIEKVKELLESDVLTLTDIAVKLHYSSAAHLSNQFKK